ncbi:NADP-dependent oxidoreductase domain-containing protein [Butyriboletus roseoflavus]|nr:NADP-dependent oxidoreductase domain-containing protein [Butyriboletus roseoflavus]
MRHAWPFPTSQQLGPGWKRSRRLVWQGASYFPIFLAAETYKTSRSIGVSNFDEKDLEILLASAKIKPAVNQILLHPYVYRRQRPILEYAAKHGIVIEAYSALIPITHQPGGPLDAPLNEIASRLGVTTDQVLLAWTKAKGAVVVTTSSKKARLQGYLAAGDIELTQEDIDAIDAAGATGEKRTCATLKKCVEEDRIIIACLPLRPNAYLIHWTRQRARATLIN